MLLRTLPIAVAALALLPAQPARAQQPDEGWRIALAAFGGGLAFSDFQRRSVSLGQVDADPRTLDQAVSVAPTLMLGASAALWSGSDWGLRFGYSTARSHFDTYSLDRGAEALDADDAESAGVAVSLLAGDLVFRLPPKIGRVRTYGFVGAGWTSYRTPTHGELEAPRQRGRWTGTFGLGARVPLESPNRSLEFELADHVTRTPWRANEIETARADVTTQESGEADAVRLVNHVRFSVGFRYAIRITGR